MKNSNDIPIPERKARRAIDTLLSALTKLIFKFRGVSLVWILKGNSGASVF
jgi:hypothetical protein